jgi:hypothetical protein
MNACFPIACPRAGNVFTGHPAAGDPDQKKIAVYLAIVEACVLLLRWFGNKPVMLLS